MQTKQVDVSAGLDNKSSALAESSESYLWTISIFF